MIEPGCKLDALVAEKVMGLSVNGSGMVVQDGIPRHMVKPYSEEIWAAWAVVEQMDELGFLMHVTNGGRVVMVGYKSVNDSRTIAARTAPHGICLAALEAVGFEHD